MANDGSITFSVWLDAKEAEKELTAVKKKILDLEAELNQQTNRKTGLEQELKAAAAAAEEAKKRLQELQAEQTRMGAANLAKPGSYSLAELRANAAQISAQQEIVAQAEAAHMAAAAAVEKQNARIEETNQKLEKEKSLYGGVQQMAQAAGDAGEDAANRTSSATIDLSTRLEKTMNRIGGLIKRVFFFSLITRALRGFREFLGKTLAANDEFSDALARLKGALLTAFAPIWNYVIPALTALINFLAKAVEAIAGFISTIFGIGGGIIDVPMMVFILGFPTQIAVASTTFILMTSSLIGTISHGLLGHIVWLPAVCIGLGCVFGAQLGARISKKSKPKMLVVILSVTMVCMGIQLIYRGM